MTTPMRATGPKTDAGKCRSSLNALKHGLTARSPQALEALAADLDQEYEEVLGEIIRHYRPRDPLEKQLVRRIARCLWRLARSEAMERRILETSRSARRPSVSYERVLKYERLVDIHLHRAMATLQRKRQAENVFFDKTNPPPSVD